MIRMTDITPLVLVVLDVVAIVITAYLIPWLKARTTEQQQQELSAWVKIAVQAAEQIYKGSGLGSTKKQYVVNFLAAKGLIVDVDAIENMIESAVLELNKGVW